MAEKDELAKIVGFENVFDDRKTLEDYSKDQSFALPVMPQCVVKPAKANEIQALIIWANQTLTPLVPISSGIPHFRGDTVPSIGGSVIVDLSRMKKIVRIERENRVAMCEPGVSFTELIPAVAKQGLRLNMPLLPRNSKSVIGSMLEREPVNMPKYQWDISDPLLCTEVIWGTGDKYRTGSAAGPGNIEEQWASGGAQKEADGPSQGSLFRIVQGAQGTMGIVTWASLRCELLPKVEEAFLVGSYQIEKLFDFIHWLIRLRLVNECFVLNKLNLAMIFAGEQAQDYYDIKDSLPPWILFYNIAGYEYLPEERVHSQIADANDVARKMGIEPVRSIGKVIANDLLKIIQKPSSEPYWKLRQKGACEDVFFVTIYDKLPGLIAMMHSLAEEANYPTAEMGVYLQPVVQGTNCHCEFNLFYNPENKDDSGQVKALCNQATHRLMDHGAFFSRPYGDRAHMILNKDAALVTASRKIKSIFDPNNVMNPGKLSF
jgi:FAD/FMN-containing dehydrogenase